MQLVASPERTWIFFKLVGTIVNNKKIKKGRKKTRRRDTINIVQCVEIVKITFIVFNVTDPLIIPMILTCLSCHEKAHNNKKCSNETSKPCCESQIMTC